MTPLVKWLVAALAAALAPLASAAAREAPLVPLYDAAGVKRVCEEGLVQARRIIDAMAAKSDPAGILEEWNLLFIEIDEASNVPGLFAALHPDKEVRAASEDCQRKYGSLNTGLNQNERIFARLVALKPANAKQEKLRIVFERNVQVGARYRDTILGVGAESEGTEMLRKFLGREPSSKPFFDVITGKS